MVWLLVVIGTIASLFLLTVAFGAPYVPTLRREQDKLFDYLNLGVDDVFVDIGAGDGRMLIGAAGSGARAIGYEINPFLWIIAKIRLRNIDNAQIKFGSYQDTNITNATVVYVFTSGVHKASIERLLASFPGVVVSNGFDLDLDKASKQVNGFFIYT